jgi:hypothetical protein
MDEPDPGLGIVGVDPVGQASHDGRKGRKDTKAHQSPRSLALMKPREIKCDGAREQSNG